MTPDTGVSFDPRRGGFIRTRELRTTEQLREIYQWSSIDAVRMWLRRHRVKTIRRGRLILVDLRDVDAVMEALARKASRLDTQQAPQVEQVRPLRVVRR